MITIVLEIPFFSLACPDAVKSYEQWIFELEMIIR